MAYSRSKVLGLHDTYRPTRTPDYEPARAQLSEVESRLAQTLSSRHASIRAWLEQADKKRSGLATQAQFRSAFGLCGIDVSVPDINRLIDQYKIHDGQVNYRAFCDRVDPIIVPESIYPPRTIIKSREFSDAENQAWNNLALHGLRTVRRNANDRRVSETHNRFKDYDKLNHGKITRRQFRAVIDMLVINSKRLEQQMQALTDHYVVPQSQPCLVDYITFIHDMTVEPQELKSMTLRMDTTRHLPRTPSGVRPEQVEEKIAAHLVDSGLSFRDFASDIDPKQTGVCSERNFSTLLRTSLCVDISEGELSTVIAKYHMPGGLIRLRECTDAVESIVSLWKSQRPEFLDQDEPSQGQDFEIASADIERIATRVKAQIAPLRNRFEESLRKSDPQRYGCVSKESFLAALRHCSVRLTAVEAEGLLSCFGGPAPNTVDWNRFVDYLDDEADKRGPRDPARTASPTPVPPGVNYRSYHASDKPDSLAALLSDLQVAARTKNYVTLVPLFLPYDRFKCGLVSLSQFDKVVGQVLGRPLGDGDIEDLVVAYGNSGPFDGAQSLTADPRGNLKVDYVRFAHDVIPKDTDPAVCTAPDNKATLTAQRELRPGTVFSILSSTRATLSADKERPISAPPPNQRGGPSLGLPRNIPPRSLPPGFGSDPAPPVNISDLLARMRRRVEAEGINVSEWLRRSDRLRKGRVVKEKFVTALAQAKFSLTPAELQALQTEFEVPEFQSEVDYVTFCHALERVNTDRRVIEDILVRLDERSRRRAVAWQKLCKEREFVANSGRIRTTEFLKLMSWLQLGLPESDCYTISEYYRDAGGFNYPEFIKQLQEHGSGTLAPSTPLNASRTATSAAQPAVPAPAASNSEPEADAAPSPPRAASPAPVDSPTRQKTSSLGTRKELSASATAGTLSRRVVFAEKN